MPPGRERQAAARLAVRGGTHLLGLAGRGGAQLVGLLLGGKAQLVGFTLGGADKVGGLCLGQCDLLLCFGHHPSTLLVKLGQLHGAHVFGFACGVRAQRLRLALCLLSNLGSFASGRIANLLER